MHKAVVFRHVHFEDLGTLAPLLRARGMDIEYLEGGIDALDCPAARNADLLVVLGGPIGVYEETEYPFLNDEIAVIRHRLDRQAPTLGICLGAQLMAHALGAAVYPSGLKEIGWAPVALTAAGAVSPLAPLADGIPVLHWHGDTFDIPAGSRHLARTDLVANQAFSIGTHALGLQFHLEATVAAFECWLIGHACEIAAAPGVTVGGLRAGATAHARTLEQVAARVFGGWLDAALAGGLRRPV